MSDYSEQHLLGNFFDDFFITIRLSAYVQCLSVKSNLNLNISVYSGEILSTLLRILERTS